MSKRAHAATNPAVDLVTGVCPHDCPDTCSWQVAVNKADRRAIDLWGDPDHAITQGRLCGKVDRYLERTYHPDRLTTPLKRVGRKGEGIFAPVSWQAALTEIAARLHEIVAAHGAEAVLPYSYAGTMGLLQGEGMASRFFNKLGASQLARTICSEAGFEGYLYTMGAAEGLEMEAFAEARLILIWGSNTLTSNMHLWPFVQTAVNRGAQVVVIDPARTRTAQAAADWIAIRPGTDAALALAMMHVIIGEALYDSAYVADHTVGFAPLAERVHMWTPERAAAITGIDAERIRGLARAYATTRPAAIRVNYGMQRHRGGGMAMRTITCLPALVGAWRDHGGIQLSASGSFRYLDKSTLQRPDLLAGRTPRILNMNRLGDALSLDPGRIAQAHYHPRPVDRPPAPEHAGPPVKAMVVYNCNPAAVAPDQAAVRAGLLREDLFTVVLEQFATDTADYADFVLPATTQLEHWDIVRPYGHLYLPLNRPAVAAVGESLPNSEIFRRLAAAMGWTDSCFREEDEAILRTLIESQTHPSLHSIRWETLLRDGYARLNLPQPYLPYAQGNYATPSGKCEFYSRRMAEDGYDPLPTFTPPAWLETQTGNQARPQLVCISPPAHSFLNSTFVNLPRLQQREERPALWIHPVDAQACGVEDGADVTVHNEHGLVTLCARVTEAIVIGTVLAPGIWWNKLSPDGRNINQITAQDEADMGAGALFYDTLVTVTPVVLAVAAAEAVQAAGVVR